MSYMEVKHFNSIYCKLRQRTLVMLLLPDYLIIWLIHQHVNVFMRAKNRKMWFKWLTYTDKGSVMCLTFEFLLKGCIC